MTIANWDSFEIDGEEIEVVTSFTFLGSEVEKEGRCDKEIKRRVAIRKATMIGLEKLWRDKHVSINTKKRIVRTLIFPTVLYGCETWTMTKKMEKKINACEMWIWRKMQRILWTEKKTNESVRMEIGIEEETLQQTALRRKPGFFGHVMRSDGLEKGMMLAHGDVRRRRGRPRRKWMDEIHEVVGELSGYRYRCAKGIIIALLPRLYMHVSLHN